MTQSRKRTYSKMIEGNLAEKTGEEKTEQDITINIQSIHTDGLTQECDDGRPPDPPVNTNIISTLHFYKGKYASNKLDHFFKVDLSDNILEEKKKEVAHAAIRDFVNTFSVNIRLFNIKNTELPDDVINADHLIKRNKNYLISWQKTAVTIAFIRANEKSEIRDSICLLMSPILALADEPFGDEAPKATRQMLI